MTGYLLLGSGLLVIGLGLWTRLQDSPRWGNRVLTGMIIVIASIYYILTH
jgi:hypothetical protein